MVAVNGENTSERPMWTEKGGLDFEGRAKWDAWAAVKGTKPDKAKLEFVRVRAVLKSNGKAFSPWKFLLLCFTAGVARHTAGASKGPAVAA